MKWLWQSKQRDCFAALAMTGKVNYEKTDKSLLDRPVRPDDDRQRGNYDTVSKPEYDRKNEFGNRLATGEFGKI